MPHPASHISTVLLIESYGYLFLFLMIEKLVWIRWSADTGPHFTGLRACVLLCKW